MLWAALALLLGLAAPAASSTDYVSIKAGETITLQVTATGTSVAERGPALPLSLFEAEQLRNAQGQVVPAGAAAVPAVPVYKTEVPPPHFKPEQVRITFRNVPGPTSGGSVHAFLTIENGYGQSLLYRVVMHKGDRSVPTDVCEVMPHLFGFEHWPYEVDSLDLSELKLVTPAIGAPRCQ